MGQLTGLSHAAELHRTWPDLVNNNVVVDPNNLPYDHYRRIAVSCLTADQKTEMRAWAEEEQPRQEELLSTTSLGR